MIIVNPIISELMLIIHNPIIQLLADAVVFDTVFGIIRCIKERKFNSGIGIDGALRKIGMLLCCVFLPITDRLIGINFVGFIPVEVHEAFSFIPSNVGLTEFFGLFFIAYESVSILKNMTLCGLPVGGIWRKCKSWLSTYTDELPDDD